MIERAIDAGVPFAWVAADTVYGVGAVEMGCARRARAMCWGWLQITSSIRGAQAAVQGRLKTLPAG